VCAISLTTGRVKWTATTALTSNMSTTDLASDLAGPTEAAAEEKLTQKTEFCCTSCGISVSATEEAVPA